MKTRILWSMASAMTAAALLLISCGPKAAPAPTTPAPTPAPVTAPAAPAPAAPTPATPAPAAPRPAASLEQPKYGGTINVIVPNFLEKFDIAPSPG